MNETSQRRLLALSAILLALVLLLIGQLVRWQILSHILFLQKARSMQSQLQEIEPHQGRILDRHGHILAMEACTYDEVTGAPLTPRPYRFYPEGSLAGHLLGFVNAEGRGFGLEKYYHDLLKGQPGQRCAGWDPLDLLRDVPPQDGADLYLALDYLLQHQVEQELARGIEEAGTEEGTAIVMDPRTGAVLAWVSHPGYDPNQFPELASTAPQLFVDPAISKQYEPGSVVKILTMAAALDSGLVTPQSAMEDREAIEVGGHVIRNWDEKGHGLVSMVDVLALSLNVCAAQLSTHMGNRAFYDYLKAFGLGQRTGVDLSGEMAGWVKQPGDADWSESELGMNSFGQGMAITPLQLIAAVAAVANGGGLMRPYVVEAWVQEGKIERPRPILVRQVISSETARQLTEMLVQAVPREAPLAVVPGYRVAGKTGTAQIPIPGGYHPKDTIASFVGYLPAEDPRIIILVKIDRPRTSPWGRDVAAPVFSRIAQRACHLLDILPQDALLARR